MPEQVWLARVVDIIFVVALGKKRPVLVLGWEWCAGWHVFPGLRDPETSSWDIPLGPRAIHGSDCQPPRSRRGCETVASRGRWEVEVADFVVREIDGIIQ